MDQDFTGAESLLDLNALNVFLTVAELGNFSEAGRRLNLTQPGVSQIVQNLERQLGVELFNRQSKTVRLTEAGQVLRPMAAELVGASRRVCETMASLHGDVFGEMSVGCSTASGKYLLPGLIARFRQQFPHVRINVLVTNRDSVIKKLLAGEIPIGVSSKRVENADLEYCDFITDEVILVAPAGHRWANYGRIYPDDLLDEPMILREDAAGTREVMLDGLRQHDISLDMLNIAMVLGNAEAIGMAVEEGLGVAFISQLAAARGLELGRLVKIQVTGMELRRNIYLVRSRSQSFTRAQRVFWDYVLAAYPETPRVI